MRHFLEQPVDYHPAFDTALAVQDEYYFCEGRVVQGFFYDGVPVPDVLGGVVEVALEEALEHVEEDTVSGGLLVGHVEGRGRGKIRFVVDSEDWAAEC